MDRPQRYTERPFPPYRHIPGRTPHPTHDPGGHSYGQPEPVLPSLMEKDWRDSRNYLYGVDLFNERYWWECHEAFEGLWHASGQASPAGQCLQTIIQCAIAHLKTDVGNAVGAHQLLHNAGRHAAAAGTTSLGIDLQGLLAATRAYVEGETSTPATLSLDYSPVDR